MNPQSKKRFWPVLLVLLFSLVLTGAALAETTQQNEPTAVVTTGALNVRVGPGIGYKIVATSYNGHVVALLGRNNAATWAKVRLFNGQEGWVNASLIDPTVAITSLTVVDAPALTAAAAVATGALNVRSGPGIGYASTAVLSYGTNVQLLGRNNNGSWVKVKLANGHEGWVNATLITPNVAISSLPAVTAPALTPMAAVSTGSLNVRSGPGVAYGITAVIDYGVNVQLLGRNNSSTWVKVKLANGHEGWVNAALITANVTIGSLPVMTSTAATAPTAVVGTGSLNVRSGPGIGYAVTSATYLGHTVTLLGRNEAGSWVKVKLANGHEGWVNATYIQASVAISSLTVMGADTAVVPTATIATYALNVRSGPGISYDIVAYYSQWQTARLLGRNSAGTWVQVQLATGSGWINAAYIQTNVAISSLAVTG
jgi:uncharacterized protein YgiM (DUF1202 family)